MARTIWTNIGYEPDLGVSIAESGDGIRLTWDTGVTPTQADIDEANTRAAEIIGGRKYGGESRLLSLLARYVIWLIVNNAAARPPVGRLRDELYRLKARLEA